MKGAALIALTAVGCSFIAVRGPQRPVVAGAQQACTCSYALPAADATGVLAMAGLGVLFAANRDSIEGGDPPGWFAPYFPYVLAAALAVPFAVSATGGARDVHACRDAKAWLAATARPPEAGREGGPCVPVEDGADVCDSGLVCEAGRCSLPGPGEGWRR